MKHEHATKLYVGCNLVVRKSEILQRSCTQVRFLGSVANADIAGVRAIFT